MVLLISLLFGFIVVGYYIDIKYNIKTVDEMRHNTPLMRYNLTGLSLIHI